MKPAAKVLHLLTPIKIKSRPVRVVKIHKDDSQFRTLRNSSGMVKGAV